MSDEIITGEGVLLDVRPAGTLSRIGALLLDMVIYFGSIILLTSVLFRFADSLDIAAVNAILIALSVTVMLILPTVVETLSRGKSVGKAAAGIRIVRDDGGPVRFRHAFTRALVGVVEIWATFGAVALITSLLNGRGKRLGDYAAGTYAVRERMKTEAAAPLFMPPPLAAWAHLADIRRLPDGLALTVRQYLGRLGSLHPTSRAQLGDELAGQVQSYVSPPPPIGTPPEAYLTAVLCERRDREYGFEVLSMDRSRRLAALVDSLPYGVPDPPD